MNKTLRNTLIVVSVLLIAGVLAGAGFAYGRMTALQNAWQNNYFDMMNGSNAGAAGDAYGTIPPGGYVGMMGGYAGMMGGGYAGMMGGGYAGMMGGYAAEDVTPLTVDEARQAVEKYLAAYAQDNLAIEEIMVFDNNAYAIVAEEDTGIGAFELLVDPVTRAVFPEYGPNMMWNLKYGMHATGYEGMMGGMMGGNYGGMMGDYGNYQDIPDVSAEMSVSPDDALQAAQRFLDQYAPGVQVSDEITAFYGYYTIDTQKDGQIVGMLSVNGFTGQVFPHTWHGAFISMQEFE